MKISSVKWIIAILLVIVGVVALIYVYSSQYSPVIEQNEKLERDIKLSETTLSSLSYYDVNKEKFIAETEQMKKDVEKILSVFPTQIKIEDEIIYSGYLEKQLGYKVGALTVGSDYSLYSMSSGHTLCAQYITVPYSANYKGFKTMIDFFNDENKTGNKYPASIVSISVQLNDGMISGNMILRRYYVLGQTSEYIPPEIPDGAVIVGIDKIFN